jgi:site-specific recombinase XerD
MILHVVGTVERAPVARELDSLAESWSVSLEAEDKSGRTVTIYTGWVHYLAAFLDDEGAELAESWSAGMPTAVAELQREHVEAYIAHVFGRRKASTASIRYRSLRRFFDWCAEEVEVADSPMLKMHGPTVPEEEVPVLGDDELRRLLKACEGPGWSAGTPPWCSSCSTQASVVVSVLP